MVMSRESAASQWARCVYLLVLLEFLQFSVGSGISSLSTESGQILPVDDASIVSADQHEYNTNYFLPKLDQAQDINQEDDVNPIVLDRPRSMLNSIRKCIVGIFSRLTQLGPDGNPSPMQNVIAETESTQYNDNDVNDAEKNGVVLDTSRRLLVRTRPFRSGFSIISHNLLWSLKRHERQRRAGLGDHALEGRRMMADTSTESTQDFLLGPPAPASLVPNDKDGWSQDYAEPDVHPPSSN